jgi:hypothetical protein
VSKQPARPRDVSDWLAELGCGLAVFVILVSVAVAIGYKILSSAGVIP